MQRRLFSPLTLRAAALASAALLALPAPAPASAAELGDVAVRSYVGQQLSADIELVALTADDMNKLPVRLASADVYRGANLTMDPALSGLRLSVVQRDQRWFLHATTLKAIDAGHVYLYLELGSGEHQVVREATVWLTADPHPAPPPTPVVAAAAAVVVAPEAVTSVPPPPLKPHAKPDAQAAGPSAAKLSASSEVKPDAALIAAIARAHPQDATARAAAPALPKAAAAFTPAQSKEVADIKPAPSKEAAVAKPASSKETVAAKPDPSKEAAAIKPATPKEAPAAAHEAGAGAAAPHEAPAGKSHGQRVADAGLPAALRDPAPGARVAGASAAPSCPVKPLRIGAKECVALDYHNTVLTSKIDELEDKVRVLQTALEGPRPKPAPAPSSVQGQSASAGQAGMTKLKYRDKKDKKDKPQDHGPKTWIWVAGGVAALAAGGGIFYGLRKRKAKQGGGVLKIWQGWRKKKSKQEALPAATPEEFMEPQ
ncbi:hypothetical protein [Rugamonas sp.]|uniref:FimV/HubP-related protein n=1 Tax=Rugamonas sp. TaxID=1926287 RepID=UPI0025CFCDC2|nr:hypothetical protein [Rugamonas sp.]